LTSQARQSLWQLEDIPDDDELSSRRIEIKEMLREYMVGGVDTQDEEMKEVRGRKAGGLRELRGRLTHLPPSTPPHHS